MEAPGNELLDSVSKEKRIFKTNLYLAIVSYSFVVPG